MPKTGSSSGSQAGVLAGDSAGVSSADRRRFERLYEEHHRMVRRVLYNMAEPGSLDDLVQETFVRIWTGLPRFHFLSRPGTWIYRITINTAIDHLRRERLRPRPTESEVLEAVPAPRASAKPEIESAIQAALAGLDEAHRSVVVLHFLEEQPIAEVARILEIPSGTVKSRLHAARARMKEFLREKGIEHDGT